MASSSKTNDGRNKYLAPVVSDSSFADDSKPWREKVPVGVKFEPNDEILVDVYLKGKVYSSTNGPIFPLIKEVDVFQHEPSELSSLTYDFGDGKKYFFAPLIKKYGRESNVIDRNVPGGFWRKTENPSYVKVGKNKKPTAMKTTLVYYKKDDLKSNPVKTQWLMEEYMFLDDEDSTMLRPWTLCVAYCQVKRRRESENIKYGIRKIIQSPEPRNSKQAKPELSVTASDDKCPQPAAGC